jgi:hypothetical protein
MHTVPAWGRVDGTHRRSAGSIGLLTELCPASVRGLAGMPARQTLKEDACRRPVTAVSPALTKSGE